jgi:hypothetical protein
MGKSSFGVEKGRDGIVRQKFTQGSGWKPADLKRHLEQPSQLKAIKERYENIAERWSCSPVC